MTVVAMSSLFSFQSSSSTACNTSFGVQAFLVGSLVGQMTGIDPLVSGDGQTLSYQPHIHANTIRSSREQHRCSHNL